MKKILVTGVAGFIGFHVTKHLLLKDFEVVGIDNLNAYYDVQLKLDRLKELGIDTTSSELIHKEKVFTENNKKFSFLQLDICSKDALTKLFRNENFEIVLNLAAQAGVRYSIENPQPYIDSNITGFFNLLENCRHHNINHLIFASSSSVYGNQTKIPFEETDSVDNPVSLYAATKKSNELMAYTYSHLYGLPVTGLRFFTVYGPWGRPDMAPFLFTRAILEKKPIKVFNQGNLMRDFTYINDIITGIIAVIEMKVEAGHNEVFNIGNNKPVKLLKFIELLEKHLKTKAIKQMYPMQEGDVFKTYASIDKLNKKTGYTPITNLDAGLEKFVEWYLTYYDKNRS